MQLAVAGIVALGASVIGTSSAGAQAAATSPFHAGQWGLEAYAAGQTGGIMRFFTPRTALVLTLSANHLKTNSDEPGSILVSNEATVFDATLGFRRHAVLASRVVGTVGAGAVAGSVQQRQEYRGALSPSSFHSSYYGAYAELGGQYMVADHFAVGVAYRLLGRHVRNSGTSQAGAEFLTNVLPVRATLYF
jgi:hypothetical protein